MNTRAGYKPDPVELARRAASLVQSLKLGGGAGHVLISCSKSKGSHQDLARNMYVSPLYRKSILTVEGWGLPYSILSAKYGLLDPNEIIEPYDLTLKGASRQFKADWARKVDKQLHEAGLAEASLVMLAGDDYCAPLLEVSDSQPIKYLMPMQGLSLGNRLVFLNECIRMRKRRSAIQHSYKLFEQLADAMGMRSLEELLAADIPKQGVYFFFDQAERSSFSSSLPRLVRVGTHGVSAGSVATLRNRLRTHFGTRAGSGNHRASVFRLHVGRALIERDSLHQFYPNWGKGQSAPKEISEIEAPLEKKVSEYIGRLRVLFIPVLDEAGVGSMRATIERQFISMFTENFNPLEVSSANWLGRFSDKSSIQRSGLWNIRDVGSEYDPKFMPLLEGLIKRNFFKHSL